MTTIDHWTKAHDVAAFNRGYVQAQFELGIARPVTPSRLIDLIDCYAELHSDAEYANAEGQDAGRHFQNLRDKARVQLLSYIDSVCLSAKEA